MTGRFRKASLDDCMLLFEWANDLETRKNSLNSAPIELSAHRLWLEKTLSDLNRILLIYEDGRPIGTVRLDFCGDCASLSYSIAPSERGKGYGNAIIRDIVEYAARGARTIKRITATVKSENAASRNVFLKNNFSEHESGGKFFYEIEIPEKEQ